MTWSHVVHDTFARVGSSIGGIDGGVLVLGGDVTCSNGPSLTTIAGRLDGAAVHAVVMEATAASSKIPRRDKVPIAPSLARRS